MHAQDTTRRCVRIQIAGWIEMELSELHVSFYRRIQREIEDSFRFQVETSLSSVRTQENAKSASKKAKNNRLNALRMRRRKQVLLRQAVGLLIRSFLPEDEDDEEMDLLDMEDIEEEEEEGGEEEEEEK